eukprot:6194795-Pleurochrysis_carterae.AAC.3
MTGTAQNAKGGRGPRDGQSVRQGQGWPQGKRNNSCQEAETGSGGELVHKGHSTPAPSEPKPPQRGGTT